MLLNRDPARSEQEASTYQEDPAPSRPTTRTKKTLLNHPVLHAVHGALQKVGHAFTET